MDEKSGMIIYAGLDSDGIARLFMVDDDDDHLVLVRHEQWLEITDRVGGIEVEAGELLRVHLTKEDWASAA